MVGINYSVRYGFTIANRYFFNAMFYRHPLIIIPIFFMGIVFKTYPVPVQNVCANIGYAPCYILVKADNHARRPGYRHTVNVHVIRNKLYLIPDSW